MKKVAILIVGVLIFLCFSSLTSADQKSSRWQRIRSGATLLTHKPIKRIERADPKGKADESPGGAPSGDAPSEDESPRMDGCFSLNRSFVGGDLAYRNMCFYVLRVSGGSVLNYLLVDSAITNLSSPIENNLGLYVTLLPNVSSTPGVSFGMDQTAYNVCIKSSGLALDIGRRYQPFDIGVHSGSIPIYLVRNLTIILDPQNNILEDNEFNNIFHCESFYEEPEGNGCMELNEEVSEVGYSGSCPYRIRELHWPE